MVQSTIDSHAQVTNWHAGVTYPVTEYVCPNAPVINKGAETSGNKIAHYILNSKDVKGSEDPWRAAHQLCVAGLPTDTDQEKTHTAIVCLPGFPEIVNGPSNTMHLGCEPIGPEKSVYGKEDLTPYSQAHLAAMVATKIVARVLGV